MAYLITYEEYRTHFTDAWSAVRHSLQTALVTACFFFLLAMAAGVLLQRTPL